MATVSFLVGSNFPDGTTIGAYLKRLFPGPPPQAGQAPNFSPSTPTAVMGSAGPGYALLVGLQPDTSYYIGGRVEGSWKWVGIRTSAESDGGGTGDAGAEEQRALFAELELQEGLVGEASRATAAESALGAALAAIAAAAGISTAEAEALFDQKGTVLGKLAPVVTTSGAFTPDLGSGHQVFPVITSGTLKLRNPINGPKVGKAVYAEVPIEGKAAVDVSALNWVGQAPNWPASEANVKRVVMLVSWDECATWAALSEDAPSSSTVSLAGEPADKDVPIWDAATETWKPGTPSVGLTMAEVDAEIASAVAATAVLKAEAQDVVEQTAVPRFGASFLLSAVESKTGVPSCYYVYEPGSAGSTLTMPVFSSPTVRIGSQITLVNNSGGAIKVKGKFNPQKPADAPTTIELTLPETVTFMLHSTGVWVVFNGYRSPSAVEALGKPAAWTNFSSLGPNIEAGTGGLVAQSRLESAGAKVALRGVLATKAGLTLAVGGRLLTLTAGQRPVGGEVSFTARVGNSLGIFGVEESGQVKLRAYLAAAEIPAATTIWLESAAPFPIT